MIGKIQKLSWPIPEFKDLFIIIYDFNYVFFPLKKYERILK